VNPQSRAVNWRGWWANPQPLGHKPLYPKELLEAGGIEPRNLDLQVLLRQTLTRLGHEGLASCLALLCSDQDIALVVEAWPGLPASCKRHILEQVDGLEPIEGCQEMPRGADTPPDVVGQKTGTLSGQIAPAAVWVSIGDSPSRRQESRSTQAGS